MASHARSDKPGEQLRASGLRSTPQRRSILAAFEGGSDEHLSAEDVYVRAVRNVPGLGRGTVYATLAEYTGLGLLETVGAPPPVRYEANTDHHAHFRCRRCDRIFDVAAAPEIESAPYGVDGHHVQRIRVTAEGVCADCWALGEGADPGPG